MPIIEAIKKMNTQELQDFVKMIYQSGWNDGRKNVDKSNDLFAANNVCTQ